MAELYHTEDAPQYVLFDRKNYINHEEQLEALRDSRTVYVGNLSFFTTEMQIFETFRQVGPVKRLIMGLNSVSKTPCGFCFIEYYSQEHAFAALKYISETVCDERIIRCDFDPGFIAGRQFGRGSTGGQIRDERTQDYDPGRGRFVMPPPPNFGGESNDRGGKRRRDGPDDDFNSGGRHVSDNRSSNYRGDQQGRRRFSTNHGDRGGYNKNRFHDNRRPPFNSAPSVDSGLSVPR